MNQLRMTRARARTVMVRYSKSVYDDRLIVSSK